MKAESRFVAYWRQTETELKRRRWRSIPMGRAHVYWLIGFTAAQAAEAEVFRRRH